MITEELKKELKEKLENERSILETELSKIGTQNPQNPSDWVVVAPKGEDLGSDRNENADIIEAMQENNAAINELELRLSAVIDALQKFENGTYGICEVSGEEIEIERLRANPAARTTIQHMND